MKTVKVKYLLHSQTSVKQNKVYERFLVENEDDAQALLKAGIITGLHLTGIRKSIVEGKQVIVNENGGYCDLEGTWLLMTEKEPSKKQRAIIQAFIAQFESDLGEKDYTAIDEVLSTLIAKKSNETAMLNFLGDNIREMMVEDKLSFRY